MSSEGCSMTAGFQVEHIAHLPVTMPSGIEPGHHQSGRRQVTVWLDGHLPSSIDSPAFGAQGLVDGGHGISCPWV